MDGVGEPRTAFVEKVEIFVEPIGVSQVQRRG